jgi:hypothetical protein
VNAPPILQRHPALRWLAPLGVACVAGLAATGFFSSSASSNASLPATTPTALIAAVQKPQVTGFSGTVVSHLSLGLPDLPAFGGESSGGTSFSSLLTGSHTMQVWYGGVDRQRVALLGSTDETDVFRDGTDLWQWSSADRSALHAVLPARASGGGVPAALSRATPLDLAQQALRAVEPTTRVDVEKNRTVADRSAYDLVLTPRTRDTKVGEVRIAVDGQTKVPLGVQILARGSSSPSVDVSFTTIVFGRQAERRFRFAPPAGAKVTELARSVGSGAGRHVGAAQKVTTTGSGWRTVATVRPGHKQLAALRKSPVLSSLTPVSGSWGSGYLLDSDLLSALLTADGRLLVGAVPPADLYAAAGRK